MQVEGSWNYVPFDQYPLKCSASHEVGVKTGGGTARVHMLAAMLGLALGTGVGFEVHRLCNQRTVTSIHSTTRTRPCILCRTPHAVRFTV